MKKNTISNLHISLTEAAKDTPYSQEYLSLRARSGKLRAKKIGRNWYTTKETVQEYVLNNQDINESANHHNELPQLHNPTQPPLIIRGGEEGLLNAWSVDQTTGKVNVNFFGDLNLQGNSILDVKKITGYLGKWSIDEDGTLMAVKVITNELIAE